MPCDKTARLVTASAHAGIVCGQTLAPQIGMQNAVMKHRRIVSLVVECFIPFISHCFIYSQMEASVSIHAFAQANDHASKKSLTIFSRLLLLNP